VIKDVAAPSAAFGLGIVSGFQIDEICCSRANDLTDLLAK
jgi:hypothetical protein